MTMAGYRQKVQDTDDKGRIQTEVQDTDDKCRMQIEGVHNTDAFYSFIPVETSFLARKTLTQNRFRPTEEKEIAFLTIKFIF